MICTHDNNNYAYTVQEMYDHTYKTPIVTIIIT